MDEWDARYVRFRRPDDPELSPLDEVVGQIVAKSALKFFDEHPEVIATEEQARELAADPKAVRLVCRWHGDSYDLAQRTMPWAARGRAKCERCQHPVYFDDRAALGDQLPGRFVCLVCVVAEIGVSEERLDCPPHCTWKAT